jgi:hypothetical protein
MVIGQTLLREGKREMLLLSTSDRWQSLQAGDRELDTGQIVWAMLTHSPVPDALIARVQTGRAPSEIAIR